MIDNRKSSITAKVAAQVVDFYKEASRLLDVADKMYQVSSRMHKVRISFYFFFNFWTSLTILLHEWMKAIMIKLHKKIKSYKNQPSSRLKWTVSSKSTKSGHGYTAFYPRLCKLVCRQGDTSMKVQCDIFSLIGFINKAIILYTLTLDVLRYASPP